MPRIQFHCYHINCNSIIDALDSQIGMTIRCPSCQGEVVIPKGGGRQPEAKTGRRQSSLGRLKRFLPEDLQPAGKVLFPEKETSRQQSPMIANSKRKRSLLDRIYSKFGELVDRAIGHDIPEGSFKYYLYQGRARFKSLSPARQRHATFFVSFALVFLVSSLISMDPMIGLIIASMWASFVGFNRVSFINKFVRFSTELAIYVSMFFLPEELKRSISTLVKYLIALSIVFYWHTIISPIYISYKLALVFMDNSEA